MSPSRQQLRSLVESGRTIAVPGATDALSAKLIEKHGFEAAYIGSYATAASRYALPDTGLLTLDDLAAQARTIASAVGIPVIADAEGGFNDPANMWRTVQAFERAGVAAIHIEDHEGAGKHTSLPQRLRSLEEAAARIRAAVEARSDADFLIAARTDALWIGGELGDAVRRLQAYADAGADLVFPTGASPAQLAEIRRRVDKPLMIVDLPQGTVEDEERAGAAIVLYYGLSTLVQFDALHTALETFRRTRDANKVAGYRERVQELEDFVGYRDYEERARRLYAPKGK
ncbi:MAG: isocitrate lyase/PEP mutase family protein [Betaproteobacteria bacterium]|nr:isocitrate lyase/PEP mutase family protein [Betaproteobacteria bacterium]MDH5352074.1 isocitrate lyase/PEP mutase family protein [Betaproteobacteria bacterium]